MKACAEKMKMLDKNGWPLAPCDIKHNTRAGFKLGWKEALEFVKSRLFVEHSDVLDVENLIEEELEDDTE